MAELRAGAVELAYETWGTEGEPVLLLHGALSTAEQNYRLVLGPLSARHRLIGLDFRGHGGSARPGATLTLDALRADVLALLDHLGLAKVHVLGTSLGGYAALALRHAAPERVATLALAGVKPGWTQAHADDRFDFFRPESILAEYPHWDKYLADLHGKFAGPDHWRGVAGEVGTLLRSLPGNPAVGWEALEAEKDRLPLFYCLGDRDALVPLATVVEVAERRPDAHILVVPPAGHLFPEYEPTVFAAAYLAFLRRNRLDA